MTSKRNEFEKGPPTCMAILSVSRKFENILWLKIIIIRNNDLLTFRTYSLQRVKAFVKYLAIGYSGHGSSII